MSFLSQLNWRHATKLFDNTQKISDENLAQLKDAIQMTPSSFGLEPFHVKIITDLDLKNKIQEISWNQPQISTSSHLLVFCARTDAQARINKYFEIASGGSDEIQKKMAGYKQMMEGGLLSKSPAEIRLWAENQTHIALGFAMAACAELEIDSCAIGGCDFKKLDELLDLPDDLKSCVMLPIGIRAAEPTHPKVRYEENDLFS